jgi:riboflavin synthase alpha subunit
MEFIFECPPLKGAMGDDSLWIRTKLIDSSKLKKSSPSSLRSLPLLPKGSLAGKGVLLTVEAVQKGCSIKNFTIKQSYHATAWYLLSISTIGDPVSRTG